MSLQPKEYFPMQTFRARCQCLLMTPILITIDYYFYLEAQLSQIANLRAFIKTPIKKS